MPIHEYVNGYTLPSPWAVEINAYKIIISKTVLLSKQSKK